MTERSPRATPAGSHDSTGPGRRRGRFVPMPPAAPPTPTTDDGDGARRTPPSRRRVYATRGLAASAVVLALSVQAGQVAQGSPADDISPCATCGDPSGVDDEPTA